MITRFFHCLAFRRDYAFKLLKDVLAVTFKAMLW